MGTHESSQSPTQFRLMRLEWAHELRFTWSEFEFERWGKMFFNDSPYIHSKWWFAIIINYTCLRFFLFQILPADRMSNRICHACISFLNSWQSFKNRCYAAQKKQQNFLDLLMAKERAKQKSDNERQRQLQPAKAPVSIMDGDQQRILKNALLNSTMRPNSTNNSSIDIVSHFFTFRRWNVDNFFFFFQKMKHSEFPRLETLKKMY